MLQNLDFNFDISQIDKFIMSHNESHNESPILAATIPATDDIVPHVVLNTTIGSPPHSSNMSSPTTPTSLARLGEICANEIAFRMGWFGLRNVPSSGNNGRSGRNAIPLGPKEKYGSGIGIIKLKKKKVMPDGKEVEVEEGDGEIVYAQMAPVGPIA
ncbi:13540_t:CDS:2 [Entrophospora sp. SA101]|nr:13540_t:CDS:2 [Entrophospora sp. SA101]